MYPDSVCQMGLAVVENNEIIKTQKFLIRPPYNDFRNSHINGVTLADVEDAKTFCELWEEIKKFIEIQLVGAYNANFDVGCLLATLENFKITLPNFAYFDILQNARENFREVLNSFRLPNVAKKLNIKLNHHDALSDTLAAAQIQITMNMPNTFGFMFSEKQQFYSEMAHLLTGDGILKLIKDFLKSSPTEMSEYQNLIRLLTIAQGKGTDRSKCLKLEGNVCENFGFKEYALDKYRMAYALNDKIGVKGKIQTLEKELSNN